MKLFIFVLPLLWASAMAENLTLAIIFEDEGKQYVEIITNDESEEVTYRQNPEWTSLEDFNEGYSASFKTTNSNSPCYVYPLSLIHKSQGEEEEKEIEQIAKVNQVTKKIQLKDNGVVEKGMAVKMFGSKIAQYCKGRDIHNLVQDLSAERMLAKQCIEIRIVNGDVTIIVVPCKKH